MPAILRKSLPNYTASHTVSGQSQPFDVVVGSRPSGPPWRPYEQAGVCEHHAVSVCLLPEPDPHIAIQAGFLGLIEPYHACHARGPGEIRVQAVLVVVLGAFRYPGTVDRYHGGATGSQYAPDLGYVLGDGVLVTEVYGVAGEGVCPLAAVVSVPLRCQRLVSMGFVLRVNAPQSRVWVVSTAYVHAPPITDPQ